MSNYESELDSYNQKIDRMRAELEGASDQTLGDLSTLTQLPFGDEIYFEDFIYEVTMEISEEVDSANSEDHEVTGDLSSALYTLDQISTAANKEIERREDSLRASENYEKAIHFLEVINDNNHPDWNAAYSQLEQKFGGNIADLAISDIRE